MKKTEEIKKLAEAYADGEEYFMTDEDEKEALRLNDIDSFIAGYTACQDEYRWVQVSERKNIEPAYYITSENGNVRVLAHDGTAFINRDGIDENVQFFINKPLPNPPKK